MATADYGSTTPKFGGVVFDLGDFRAEVFVQPDDSQVQAIVSRSRPNQTPYQNLRITVTAACAGSANETTMLHWNSTEHLFMGYLNCKNPTTGPMTINLTEGGQTFRGYDPVAPAIPTPRYGGYVVGAGPFVFELLPWIFGVVELVPRDGTTYRANDRLSVQVVLPIASDETQTVEMKWDPKRRRFVGRTPSGVGLKFGAERVVIKDSCEKSGRAYVTGIEAATPLQPPKMAGALISTGTYTVELAATPAGLVEGIVLDRNGKQASAAHIQLIVNAIDSEGNVYPVAMNWNNNRGRFAGFLKIRSTHVVSYYAKVRGGDAVSRDPHQAMNNLIGRIRIRNLDEAWMAGGAQGGDSKGTMCGKSNAANRDREDKYDRNSKSPFL